ncbi:MAG TPA: alpha/beta hydrolase [Burkholderiaceae bacterium]|nr:alpha/beta hydrolase [Burkholderiaceae bacterium]
MAAREHSLRAADGTPLFVADWSADAQQTARGGIVLMHGLGEHCGRYTHVVRFFNACGWSVRTYDHRGHGRSGGAPGDVPDGEAVFRDAELVIADFARQFDEPPLLFGHSMGGLFAARFAAGALAPLRGLILSSPALALPLNSAQKLLLKTLGAIAPGLAVPNGVPTRYLSHDPAVIKAYDEDPLVHPKISARLLNCMLEAIGFAQMHASALTIPTLLVIAGDDRIVDVSGSQTFFRQLRPGIGTIHVYPDFYHEVFNEVDARRVFGDVHAWLAAHHWSAATQDMQL